MRLPLKRGQDAAARRAVGGYTVSYAGAGSFGRAVHGAPTRSAGARARRRSPRPWPARARRLNLRQFDVHASCQGKRSYFLGAGRDPLARVGPADTDIVGHDRAGETQPTAQQSGVSSSWEVWIGTPSYSE
jgi:hypothetical protein